VDEVPLAGGNAGGAVLAIGTVRRRAGPWTSTIQSLLKFLEMSGFEGAPRALGFDDKGREVLSFLQGETVGDTIPWPAWVHSDAALVDVGRWLRRYHDVVVDFEVPGDAQWRTAPSAAWRPGDVIGHNDAAPYNAVWRSNVASGSTAEEQISCLIGFIDWDFAAPCPAIWDLAFVASSWVPLHAREVALREGFTAFDDRPRRLRLLLDSYGYDGTVGVLLEAVQARLEDHIRGIEELARAGDPLFQRLIDDGVITRIERGLVELADDASGFDGAG
jgi:hypothetical protein